MAGFADRDRQAGRCRAGQVSGAVRSISGSGVDLDLAEAGDRGAVVALDLARLGGPGGEDDGGDLEPGGAGGLDRQQGVVDRAEAGRGGDDHGVAEVGGQVADQVAGRERHQQAADPLADDRLGAGGGGRRGGAQPLGLDLLAGQRRRQVRRGRRAVAVGRDLRVALGGPDAAQQLVVRQPTGRFAVLATDIVPSAGGYSSRPVTQGLKTATRRPAAARVRASTAATTVLPTSVPVPVTKTPGGRRSALTSPRRSGRDPDQAELAGRLADLPRGALAARPACASPSP